MDHDVSEQSRYGEVPGAATPGSPVNVDDVHGLELPLRRESGSSCTARWKGSPHKMRWIGTTSPGAASAQQRRLV